MSPSNNEEVFGLDDLGDVFGDPPLDDAVEDEGEYNDDFQFDFGDGTGDLIYCDTPTRPEGIDTTNRDGETRHIREWVSRTITPQPVDYTVNTTFIRNPRVEYPLDDDLFSE